jgi:hypothetical protein
MRSVFPNYWVMFSVAHAYLEIKVGMLVALADWEESRVDRRHKCTPSETF